MKFIDMPEEVEKVSEILGQLPPERQMDCLVHLVGMGCILHDISPSVFMMNLGAWFRVQREHVSSLSAKEMP